MENIISQDAQFVAENDGNVDVDKIAEIYAEAYMNAVKSNNNSIDDAVDEFASLVNILKSNDKFSSVLASARITSDEKIALLEKALKKSASELFINFLKVVARRNRLDILAQIYRQARIIFDKQHKLIPVVITTATEIDSELINTLSAKLAEIIGGTPIIRNVVDPKTIGGLIVRVGDTVYDASLITQLNSVRKQIIERSAQEIQSRRNNFQNE
ncbi:MAG: ATP synthase F1 subunit delta [Planctomycetaceae bacterium]|jgi:F-type H+-transporting ATPase subunit delta|nr:ATP synthase F1 subunit delta [Planctomycetaceae bacterium]